MPALMAHRECLEFGAACNAGFVVLAALVAIGITAAVYALLCLSGRGYANAG